jgi:UDP-N-acetyl-D-mannosaminuronate dehydrogenase
LERSNEFEPLAVRKAKATKGFGFDIGPRTMESIEKRKENDLDLETRTVAKERSERKPEKLDHGIVVAPWTCRRALLQPV